MEIVVGTYEELILGFKLKSQESGYSLDSSFTDHSHLGCVKTVSISPRGVLASGSSDEMVRIYNLRTRKEMGALAHHQGTVTCVGFHGRHHMMTGSEDGTLGVWKAGRWECLRTLRGHKDHVVHFSIHPSGKMALSVSKDHTLKTWNLMTGKCAYTTNIKQTADLVLWSPCGTEYVLITGDTIALYKVETGTVHQTIKCSSRICTAVFIRDSVLAVAGEGGDVHLFDMQENKHIMQFATDTNRVKCMCRAEFEDSEWLVVASSDGFIQLWRLDNMQDSWDATRVLSHNTKFRPLCVAVHISAEGGEDQKGEVEEQPAEEELQEEAKQKHQPVADNNAVKETKKRKVIVETESSSPKKKLKKKHLKEGKLKKNKKKQLF